MKRCLLVACLSAVTAACNCGEIHGVRATRLAFAVQPSSALAGAAIAPVIQVAVQDDGGNTVTSATDTVTLTLGANPGGATLSGTLSVQAVAGVATFADVSLDRAATGYRLVAASGVLASATSGAFDISAGAVPRVEFSVQPVDVTAGVAISPAVQVRVVDAAGNLVSSATDLVSIAIGANPGGGALSGTVSTNAVGGVATFVGLSIDRAGAGYTLTASATGLAGATSNAFSILAGPSAKLVFTSELTNTTAGQTLSTVGVEIRDAYGNRTASTATVDVALASGPPGAVLAGTKSVAAVAGVASFSNLSIALAGTGYSLTATSVALTSATSNPFSILAGAASKIVFSVQPSSARVNLAMSPVPTVAVADAYGNTVVTASDSITVALGANPGGATLSGTLTRSTTSGAAAFAGLSLNKVANGYTLAASSTKYGNATSATFNVVPQSGLVYTDPPAGGKIRLVVNGASTPTTVVLDLVAAVPLNGYSVGFNLPLDTTRVTANTTLMTAGTALRAGSAPSAAAAVLPTSGPLASMLVTGQSQKAAGTGAVTSDSAISAGAVFYTVRLDAIAGAPTGVVFDGAALGPKFRAALREKLGTDVATATDFRIGRLDLF